MTDNQGVGYDYRSVMHYSSNAFSKNGQPTIVPKVISLLLLIDYIFALYVILLSWTVLRITQQYYIYFSTYNLHITPILNNQSICMRMVSENLLSW